MIDANDSTLGVLSAFMVTLSGIVAIVMVVLRRSSNAKIDGVKHQVDGFGKRLNEHSKDVVRNSQICQTLEVFRGKSEDDSKRLWVAVSEGKAKVDSIERAIATQHHDIMEAIQVTGRQQMEAVHKVELQVATLAAKADVTVVLGETLGRIAEIMEHRDTP